jgi:probable HAF family extracellular repeat protein
VKAIDLGNLGWEDKQRRFRDQRHGAGGWRLRHLPGDQFQHAFLWQHNVMSDLGTLPGDVASAAIGVNNRAQATGVSIDAAGNLRAFLWQDGVMTDLNTLIPPNSPLYLMHGCGINSRGQIVGFASQISTGELHAYLATPDNRRRQFAGYASSSGAGPVKVALPESARKQLHKWVRGSRQFATASADPTRILRVDSDRTWSAHCEVKQHIRFRGQGYPCPRFFCRPGGGDRETVLGSERPGREELRQSRGWRGRQAQFQWKIGFS